MKSKASMAEAPGQVKRASDGTAQKAVPALRLCVSATVFKGIEQE